MAGLACNHGHGVLASVGLKHAYLTHIRRATRSASAGRVSFDPQGGSRRSSVFPVNTQL
jgi:hypothetical protein